MDDASPRTLPGLIREKLLTLRPLLETQGVIQLKGKDYRLRYREFDGVCGYVRHKSLILGDERIAAAAKDLIKTWRAERDLELTRQAQFEQASRDQTRERHMLRRRAQDLAGGGDRRRQRIGKWFDQVHAKPLEMFAFSVSGKFPDPPPVGRPRKCALW
jgi:hypothetical protein